MITPRSNIVSQGQYSYSLTVRGGTLTLSAQAAEQENVIYRRCDSISRKAGESPKCASNPGFHRGGLCAVVEVTVGDEYQYSCVTLSAPTRSRGYDSASARFHSSKKNLSILALNGTFRGDSVLALLGVVETKGGLPARVVSRGIVYLDDCPVPPSRGSISKFEADTSVDPALIELLKSSKRSSGNQQ